MPVTATNETARLAALRRLQVLDTPPEPSFDRLVEIARSVFGVPIALVSLIDSDRQWFKAKCGLAVSETHRDLAFCNYTILHDTVLAVPDARRDPTFANNPLVTGEPHIRFYAGAPLITAPGIRLGSLCVIDTKPREFDAADARVLAGLAKIAVDEIWLRDLLRGDIPHPQIRQDDFSGGSLDLGEASILTGAQVRAARALLDWSISQLSSASGVSQNTIKRVEAEGGNLSVRPSTVEALTRTFSDNGVAFTGRNRAAAGVCFAQNNPG
ncbi:GAF domain-containing protein [Methylobacterium durans]|uniref:Diguanylate cyclase n=1 Tax=Methylobacterium durans TaxID=2202825 RepID=A0A2U8W863_9HYPH|nr:GAF domain-containing protein [Methylobacterium durans]AWN42314.1 diguanylate cyclase [Methylobacterium durans]